MSKASGGPQLIFLYGPPAVGKLTVRKRSRSDGTSAFSTTTSPSMRLPKCSLSARRHFWEALDKVRLDLVTAAAREAIDLVYTFVFAPGDETHVDDVVSAYESAGGLVVFVQLVAPPDELRRRVSDASRAAHSKIRDAGSLDKVLRDHDVYASLPGRESLTIDAAAMSPDEAARRIGEHIDALRSEDDGRS